MKKQRYKVLYAIEDHTHNTRRKYGGLFLCIYPEVEMAKEYVDSGVSRYHIFYFTTQEKMGKFFLELEKYPNRELTKENKKALKKFAKNLKEADKMKKEQVKANLVRHVKDLESFPGSYGRELLGKEKFTKTDLVPLVKAHGYDDAEYVLWVRESGDFGEYVKILHNGAFAFYVCVSIDSHSAMVKDVTRGIESPDDGWRKYEKHPDAWEIKPSEVF